jgi:hypothetical protein
MRCDHQYPTPPFYICPVGLGNYYRTVEVVADTIANRHFEEPCYNDCRRSRLLPGEKALTGPHSNCRIAGEAICFESTDSSAAAKGK